MTYDDLLERVARMLYCAGEGMSYDLNKDHVEYWFNEQECAANGDCCLREEYECMARAALTVAIEACAAVVEGQSDEGVSYQRLWSVAGEIRKLMPIIKEPEDG